MKTTYTIQNALRVNFCDGVRGVSRDFIQKVVWCYIVDTQKYRYIAHERGNGYIIRRIPLRLLGTTKAINEWSDCAEVTADAD